MPSKGREQPLCCVSIRSGFVDVVRLQRRCDVDDRSIRFEWCFDRDQAIEDHRTVLIVRDCCCETIARATQRIVKALIVNARLGRPHRHANVNCGV